MDELPSSPRRWRQWPLLVLSQLLLALASLAAPAARTADSAEGISWDPGLRRLQAHVRSWPLHRVLQDIARDTGWQVFLDTNITTTVSSRFSGLPIQEALRRLLPEASFSLMPQSNAAPRLFVFRGSIEDARVRVHPSLPDTPSRIRNELIVRLQPGSKLDLGALAGRLGGHVIGRADELNAVRLGFDSEASAERARLELEAAPDVVGIESNFALVPPSSPESGNSVLPPLTVRPSASAASGDPVIVALLDTAVERPTAVLEGFLLPQVHTAGTGTSTAEASPITHGTAMAETLIRALAAQTPGQSESNVRILPVDIYGAASLTSTFDIVRGLYAAADHGADVINLSLAGEGDSPLMHDAIRALRSQNVLVFAASGNEPTTAPMFPAAYPEVTAVTAGGRDGQVAAYANRGGFIDLIAPGTSVVESGGQAYLVTGTSASTARISGIAAALLDRGMVPPADILKALREVFAFSPPPAANPADAAGRSGAPGSR